MNETEESKEQGAKASETTAPEPRPAGFWDQVKAAPIWVKIVVPLVLLVLLIGILGSGENPDDGDGGAVAVAEAADRPGDSEEIERLESELEAVTAERDALRDELDTLKAEIKEEKKELKKRERDLDRRESDVVEAEVRAVMSTITDGVWEVGSDIEPGTYRAPGGSMCYWATLGSADTSDMTNNSFGGSNQTVQLSGGWFETSDCGEWEKIK